MFEHTAECKALQASIEQSQVEYDRAWPNYCRACDGYGVRSYSDDPSPVGVSLSAGSMTFDEPCGVCWEHGFCPRCRAQSWPDDEVDNSPCSTCGWVEADGGRPLHMDGCECEESSWIGVGSTWDDFPEINHVGV